MAIFDKFEDALEDAKWAADNERMRQYVYLRRNGTYKVTPKYSSVRPKQTVVEVGLTPKRYRKKGE